MAERRRKKARRYKDDPAKGTPETALVIALNHPIRRQILRTFQDGKPRSASDIAEVVRAPLSGLSYHLGVLKKLGVVKPFKDEPVKGAVKRICIPQPDTAKPYVITILSASEARDDKEVPRALEA